MLFWCSSSSAQVTGFLGLLGDSWGIGPSQMRLISITLEWVSDDVIDDGVPWLRMWQESAKSGKRLIAEQAREMTDDVTDE